MENNKDCQFDDIEHTIKIYGVMMNAYRNEMDTCIQNWELYEEFQNNKDLINSSLPKMTAIHSFNTIQYSLIQVTWLTLMKLWDDANKYNDNVRLSLIYFFIKNKKFLNFIKEKYSEYPDILEKYKNEINQFKGLYETYTNGKLSKIYRELKRIRNEILAHSDMDSDLIYLHSEDELRDFYNNTVRMVELAYSLFNVHIELTARQKIVRRNARSFVAVLAKVVAP